MSSGATRSRKGLLSRAVDAVRSVTRSKKAGLHDLRIALLERQLERDVAAGNARRAAKVAANTGAANAKAVANAKASNKRAKKLAATLLRRGASRSRSRSKSRSQPALREPTKHRDPYSQTHEQNPRGMAAGWAKSRNEFNNMTPAAQEQYYRVLQRLGYDEDLIYRTYYED